MTMFNRTHTYLGLLSPDLYAHLLLYTQMPVPVFNANRQLQSPEFIYDQIFGVTVAVRRFEQAQISRFRSVPAGTCIVLSQSGHNYNVRTFPSGKLIDHGVLPMGFTFQDHGYSSRICISGNYIIKFIPEIFSNIAAFYKLHVREYGRAPLPIVQLSTKISKNIATGDYNTLQQPACVLDDKYLVFADQCYLLINQCDPEYSHRECPDAYLDITNVCTHEFCSRNNMQKLQRRKKKKTVEPIAQYQFGSWTPHMLYVYRRNVDSAYTYSISVFSNTTNMHNLYIRGNILNFSYDVAKNQVRLSYGDIVCGNKPKRYVFYSCCSGNSMPLLVCSGNILYVFTRLTSYVVFQGRSIGDEDK